MPLICLCYAREDEALGAQIAGMLRGRGAAILSEPAADQDLSGPQRADGVAARTKAADMVAVIAGASRDGLAQARRALRGAFAYDRRIAAARLDDDVFFDDLARDPATRAGTPYGAREDEAAAKVYTVADLRRAPVQDPFRAEPETPTGFSDAAIEAYVGHILEVAARGGQEKSWEKRQEFPADEFDEAKTDSLGFPKRPAAMLARWRMIEPRGSVQELEAFLADYADDPYFAVRAAGVIQARRRRAPQRMSGVGLQALLGALIAGGLIGAAAAYCPGGACGGPASSLPIAGGSEEPEAIADFRARQAEAEREAQRLRDRVIALQTERNALQAQMARSGPEGASPPQAASAAIPARPAAAAATDEALRARYETLQKDHDALLALLNREREQRASAGVAATQIARGDQSAAEHRREIDRLTEEASAARQEAGAAREEAGAAREEASAAQEEARAAREEAGDLRELLQLRDAEIRRLWAEEAASDATATAASAPPSRVAAAPSRTPPAAAPPAVKQPSRSRPAAASAPRPSQSAQRASRGQKPPPPPVLTSALKPIRARDEQALQRVLTVLRAEHAVARPVRRPDDPPEANLRDGYLVPPNRVRRLQRCLTRETGRRVAADGLWGPQTTAALMSVDRGEAALVVTCLGDGA